MKMTAWVAALVAGLALAPWASAEISGMAGAGYANATGGVNGYTGAGAVLVSFAQPGLNLQISGGDDHFTYSSVSADLVTVTSDIFWRDKRGAMGVSGGYHRLSGGGRVYGYSLHGSGSVESYGGFGEWYAANFLTLRIKGGGYSGDLDGAYAGGGFGFYLGRNLALNGSYNYLSVNGGGHTSTAGSEIEAMPYQPWPVSVAVQYAHGWAGSGGGSSDTIGVALKLRFGAASDLRSWDRSGPTQWNGALAL